MRARHRHFNPAHAGAAFALDARYGFSQSDNTDVDSWDDRTTNNRDASQATVAYKPKYRTAIQGGQPVVEFVAGVNSKDRLDGNVTITNDLITTVAVLRLGLGSGAPSFARAMALAKDSLNDYDGSGRCAPITRNSTNSQLYSVRSGSNTGTVSISLDTWYHVATTFDGATNRIRLNETTTQSVNSTGNFDINKFRIGMAFDSTTPESFTTGAWTGYIAHVSLYNSALSDSMRKRAQFANAFSYKLSCN